MLSKLQRFWQKLKAFRLKKYGKRQRIIFSGFSIKFRIRADGKTEMLTAKVPKLDGVLYTHPHADHVHGIDDLRGYALVQRERIKIYADKYTMARLYEGFGYCLKQPEGSMYPPILDAHELTVGEYVEIKGEGGSIYALPILQVHGSINSLGFRFSKDKNFKTGGLCYSSDVSDIPNTSITALENLDCWILDALQYKPHVSHFSVSESLEWVFYFNLSSQP